MYVYMMLMHALALGHTYVHKTLMYRYTFAFSNIRGHL